MVGIVTCETSEIMVLSFASLTFLSFSILVKAFLDACYQCVLFCLMINGNLKNMVNKEKTKRCL